MKELLQAVVMRKKFLSKSVQLSELEFEANPASSAGIFRYPTLSRPHLRYTLYTTSLEVQRDVVTKRAKFKQMKFYGFECFPGEVSCCKCKVL